MNDVSLGARIHVHTHHLIGGVKLPGALPHPLLTRDIEQLDRLSVGMNMGVGQVRMRPSNGSSNECSSDLPFGGT